MPAGAQEGQFVSHAFNGVIALFGILVAVLSILLALYVDVQGYRNLATAFRLLMGGVAVALVIAALSAGLSIAHMRGSSCIPVALIAGLLYLLLTGVTIIGLAAAWITLFSSP